MSDDFQFEDAGESYCVGDLPPEEIDWDAVQHLADVEAEVMAIEDSDVRDIFAVGLLHDLYGDDLQVL